MPSATEPISAVLAAKSASSIGRDVRHQSDKFFRFGSCGKFLADPPPPVVFYFLSAGLSAGIDDAGIKRARASAPTTKIGGSERLTIATVV